VPHVPMMAKEGLGALAIAKELGVSRSVVYRTQQAAQNEGVLGFNRRRQQPKTVAMTTTTLDKRDQAIVLLAIGIAISTKTSRWNAAVSNSAAVSLRWVRRSSSANAH